jgi:hypothetical protein
MAGIFSSVTGVKRLSATRQGKAKSRDHRAMKVIGNLAGQYAG